MKIVKAEYIIKVLVGDASGMDWEERRFNSQLDARAAMSAFSTAIKLGKSVPAQSHRMSLGGGTAYVMGVDNKILLETTSQILVEEIDLGDQEQS